MPPLLFLQRLQREALPYQVTEPSEVRRVSVLAATGLIEAVFQSWVPGLILDAPVLWRQCTASPRRDCASSPA